MTQEVAFEVDERINGWLDITWKGWNGQPTTLSFFRPTDELKKKLFQAMHEENKQAICKLWDETIGDSSAAYDLEMGWTKKETIN